MRQQRLLAVYLSAAIGLAMTGSASGAAKCSEKTLHGSYMLHDNVWVQGDTTIPGARSSIMMVWFDGEGSGAIRESIASDRYGTSDISYEVRDDCHGIINMGKVNAAIEVSPKGDAYVAVTHYEDGNGIVFTSSGRAERVSRKEQVTLEDLR